MKRWLVAGVVSLVAIAGSATAGGAQLKIALEDRGDPNPRQVAMGVRLFGACLGLAVSWTRHHAEFG